MKKDWEPHKMENIEHLLADDVTLYQTESGKLIISDDSDEGIYTHIDLILARAGIIEDTRHYATFEEAHRDLEGADAV